MKRSIMALIFYYALPITATAQYTNTPGAGLFFNESAGATVGAKPGSYLAMHLTDSTKKHDYDYYMRKRKRNKNTGWILLGSGFALIGIAALVSETDNNNNGYGNNNSGSAVAACLVASAAAGLASVPFMIIASVNKNKAKALISTQGISKGTAFPNNHVTCLTMAWTLGK